MAKLASHSDRWFVVNRLCKPARWVARAAFAMVPTRDGIGADPEIELGAEGFVEICRLQRHEFERVLAPRDSNDVPPFKVHLLSPIEDERRVVSVGNNHLDDRFLRDYERGANGAV